MRLDHQILLKSSPLNLLAGSSPGYAEGRWFDSLFGWFRATQQCGCNAKDWFRRSWVIPRSFQAAALR